VKRNALIFVGLAVLVVVAVYFGGFFSTIDSILPEKDEKTYITMLVDGVEQDMTCETDAECLSAVALPDDVTTSCELNRCEIYDKEE
jgi:hypothetical protein